MIKCYLGDLRMEQLTRSELRVKIMTILYQINVYQKNKIPYQVDDIIKEVATIDNEFIKEVVYGVLTYQKDIVRKMINGVLDKVYHEKEILNEPR